MHYLEEELRNRVLTDHEIFEFLQKGSLDGLWYWDIENPEHEWMSDEFWELLGVEPGTRPHSPEAWQDMIDPSDLHVAMKNFNAHLADPSAPYDQIVRYRHQKTGKTITVRCRGIAIRNEAGEPVRMLGAHSDLTDLVEKQEELARVLSSRDQFFRNISHELRTPMNGIIGLTQLLRRNEPDARRLRMFDAIESSANALMGMLDGLLDYARIDAGQFEYAPALIDPRRVVSATATLYQTDLDELNGQVITDFSKAPWDAHLSALALSHVAQNLLANAVKFGRGSQVDVAVISDDAGGIFLSVADRGPGIADEDLPHIFDDLYQGKEGRARGGTGIGLSLSKRLCEGHGGSLRAHNRPGGGAEFVAHLPEMMTDVQKDQSHEAGLRVLVADDVEINLLVVSEMLKTHGANCTLVRDGRDALTHLRSGGFDAALLDIAMPDMTGVEVLQAFIESPGKGAPEIPIASHSAHMQPDQLARYREAGFGFHLPKPVTITDVARLTDWFGQSARA